MKYLAPLALGLLCMTTVAHADNDNMIGLTTPNGKLVYDFINMWFNEHKPAEAFDKYVSHDDYMNHAVYSAIKGKKKTFEEEKAEEAQATPATTTFEFKQLISQGDLVFAHIMVHTKSNPFGNELVEIIRVKNGKIVDHWDMHEKMKEDSAVFEGLDR